MNNTDNKTARKQAIVLNHKRAPEAASRVPSNMAASLSVN